MTPEQTAQFEDMLRKVDKVYQWMEAKQKQQITFPVDDASRKVLGVGFMSRGTEVTPAGTVIVNSNEGPLKLLYAT